EAGLARKRAMLEELRAAVLWRRRSRAGIRWGSAAAMLLFTALVLWIARPLSREGMAPPQEAFQNVQVEYVHDQPDILARETILTAPLPRETFVDDEALLALLARAHRPSGLIRVGGRVMLTDNRNQPTRP